MFQNVLYRLQQNWGKPGEVITTTSRDVDVKTGVISNVEKRYSFPRMVCMPWDVANKTFSINADATKSFESANFVVLIAKNAISRTALTGAKIIVASITYEVKGVVEVDCFYAINVVCVKDKK